MIDNPLSGKKVVITPDAWAQISSHMPMTEERRNRAEQVAAQRQRGVEELLRTGVRTRPLAFVRALEPPVPGFALRDVFTAFDGSLVAEWKDIEHNRIVTIEAETGSLATLSADVFSESVDYIVPLPHGLWLGTQARVTWSDEDRVLDNAWIVDSTGATLASGCLGDAHLRPVIGTNSEIWVPYFDEAPFRGEDIREYSDDGRLTAGFTGMTVFDTNLRVVGRHHSGTAVGEVHATHTDGSRFWYVTYPEWTIDVWTSEGQGVPLDSSDFKGTVLLAFDEELIRFSGPGDQRDTLYTRIDDGWREEVVTLPDGSALRPGQISTWGHTLHYLDGVNWYALDVRPPRLTLRERMTRWRLRRVARTQYIAPPTGQPFLVSGVTYRQENLQRAGIGKRRFRMVREPENAFDPTAVAVYCGRWHIGYVSAKMSGRWTNALIRLEKQGKELFVRGRIETGGYGGLKASIDCPFPEEL